MESKIYIEDINNEINQNDYKAIYKKLFDSIDFCDIIEDEF